MNRQQQRRRKQSPVCEILGDATDLYIVVDGKR